MMWCVSGVSGVCSEMTSHSRASVLGVGVFDAVLLRPLGRWKRIEREHAHAEAAQDLRGDAADFSRAENAGGLAVQVEADEAVEREVQVMHAVVGARDFAIEREEQRDGVLGDGVGRVGRDARDREAEFLRGGEVDAVEAGAAQRDVLHAELRERFEARAVHAVIHERADGLRAVRGRGGFGGEAAVHETPLDVESGGGALEWFAVVGFGVEDDGLDHGGGWLRSRFVETVRRLPGDGGGLHSSFRLATPGRVLPSRSSSEAPPPVEAWVTWSITPNCFAAVAVSPPPTPEARYPDGIGALNRDRVEFTGGAAFRGERCRQLAEFPYPTICFRRSTVRWL